MRPTRPSAPSSAGGDTHRRRLRDGFLEPPSGAATGRDRRHEWDVLHRPRRTAPLAESVSQHGLPIIVASSAISGTRPVSGVLRSMATREAFLRHHRPSHPLSTSRRARPSWLQSDPEIVMHRGQKSRKMVNPSRQLPLDRRSSRRGSRPSSNIANRTL